ncbi:carboxymuconolactone decarboxylase family protein [Wenxinia marina]|uniref:Carboxymuconolactone decarboxylase-like domain-containing protein n=1 Tax=Wenxinia marina DSM 24838 TaxID=1123501 RepID=A0A0D0QDY6_9RHOB|nr:carboxymuconolactone decarboxylase family protein [Wenxinia marina]KIQ69223.1 hypothetical protein Wenmar_02294 [Wenxinia marina DSM 24838]GGL71260.1 hypothetical protein GCM10011392_27320 [Wenxinia marina]
MSFLHDRPDAPDGRPNYERAFDWQPGIYAGWQTLSAAVRASLPPRLYELATLAAAVELRSSYCALAHSRQLIGLGMDGDAILAALRREGLSPLEAAAMDYASAIARDAASVEPEAVERLRDAGADEATVSALAATASLRCFFAKYLDAVGARPDPDYADLPPALTSALVLGRPIAAG